MKHLKSTLSDHILTLQLDRGKSNTLETELLNELTRAVSDAEKNPEVKAVILTGKEHFFSAGLDLFTLYAYNEEEILVFWKSFFESIETLLAFPKPLVAAISGHSPAGGCVLAICCDYRVMAQGDYIIGLNEAQVGLIVPESIFELYAFWIGKAQAFENLLSAKLLTPPQALTQKLINDITPAAILVQHSEEVIKNWLNFNQNSWKVSKMNFKKEILTKLQSDKSAVIGDLLDFWWQPSTRKSIEHILNSLKKKA